MALRTDRLQHPPIGGRACLFEWNIQDIAHFLFEVPTSKVLPYLPRGVYPVEPRPGISLLDVGYVAWSAGNWEPHWPAINEVSVLLIVQPDLSVAMPIPKFAFFAINICADFKEFLETEPVQLHLPTCYSPMTANFRASPYGVDVTSPTGPVVELRNTQPEPRYAAVDYVGQFFTVDRGILYMGIWQWIGVTAEHQVQGDAGRLFDHAAFRDIPVAAHRTVYMQLFSKPGTRGVQRFYEPLEIGRAVYDGPAPRIPVGSVAG